LKVVGEISEWNGHSPEVLKNMKDNLSKLKEQGIEAINE
jgi:rifampin ADP-ribosylating transferase